MLQLEAACRLPRYQSTGTPSAVAYGLTITSCLACTGEAGFGWKTTAAATRPSSPDVTTTTPRTSAGRIQLANRRVTGAATGLARWARPPLRARPAPAGPAALGGRRRAYRREGTGFQTPAECDSRHWSLLR